MTILEILIWFLVALIGTPVVLFTVTQIITYGVLSAHHRFSLKDKEHEQEVQKET